MKKSAAIHECAEQNPGDEYRSIENTLFVYYNQSTMPDCYRPHWHIDSIEIVSFLTSWVWLWAHIQLKTLSNLPIAQLRWNWLK